MATGEQHKGLSAAAAGHVVRRTAKVRLIEPASIYTITNVPIDCEETGGKIIGTATGTFKIVARLCPKIKTSTLKRRLDGGERDLLQLQRAPESKQAMRRRHSASAARNARQATRKPK
jgi:hypothetical protein